MRFSIATVLAFASAALAQTAGFDVVTKPTDQEKIPAGKAYEIVWSPSAEYSGKTVSIILVGGKSQPEQSGRGRRSQRRGRQRRRNAS